jgi:hypothetical protein
MLEDALAECEGSLVSRFFASSDAGNGARVGVRRVKMKVIKIACRRPGDFALTRGRQPLPENVIVKNVVVQ